MRLLQSLFAAALVLAAIAPARAQDSILDTVLKRDKIIVATYSTSPPLAYVDEKGDLVGFEIDMAHEIAKARAMQTKWSSSSCNPMGGFRRRYPARWISAFAPPPSNPIARCGSRSRGLTSTPATA